MLVCKIIKVTVIYNFNNIYDKGGPLERYLNMVKWLKVNQ